MTKDINQISIVGNLVNDPRFFTSQTSSNEYAVFTVATGRHHNPNNQDIYDDESFDKQTTYHEVRVYVNHIVEISKGLMKGDRVVVCGEIRNSPDGSYIILLAPNARFYKVV